jgi:hypothetical protein
MADVPLEKEDQVPTPLVFADKEELLAQWRADAESLVSWFETRYEDGIWPARKPRTVSEQRTHRSRRTLRLRCDKRLEFPLDPWPFQGTRLAVQGSPNRVYQTPVERATREPYPCLVVVNAVHKLRGGAETVDAGKGSV